MSRGLFLFACIFLLLLSPNTSAWWDNSWQNRRPIQINNIGGSELNDYQVLVNLSDNPINASSLRVVNETAGSVVPHWAETVVGGDVTRIWFNCAHIPANSWLNDTYYIYYNNPSASSSSNGSATFEFFDDWNVSINNGLLTEVLSTELGYGAEDRGGCWDPDNDVAYLYGGSDGGDHDTIQKFTPPDTVETLTETLPNAFCRIHLSTIFNTNDGCSYMYGGRDSGGTRDEIVKHDPDTGTVTTLSEKLTLAVDKCTAVYVPSDNVTYIFGGLQGQIAKNNIWKHDHATGTVSELSATIPTPSGFDSGTGRAGMAAAYDQANEVIYLLGGSGTKGGSGEWSLNEVLKFDISTESISLESYTLPYELDDPQAFFDEDTDRIYFMGGYHWSQGGADHVFYSEKVIKIDPSSGTVEIDPASLPLGMDDYPFVWDKTDRVGYALGVLPSNTTWNKYSEMKKIVKFYFGSDTSNYDGTKFDNWHNPHQRSSSVFSTNDYDSRSYKGAYTITSFDEDVAIRVKERMVGSDSDGKVAFFMANNENLPDFDWSTAKLYEFWTRFNPSSPTYEVHARWSNAWHGGVTSNDQDLPRDTWVVREFRKAGTKISIADEDGDELVSSTDSGFTFNEGKCGFWLWMGNDDDDFEIDWFIVRKFVDPEPSSLVGGEEESTVSENDYIPPDPTNLQHTISGTWVNYTWSAGTGNKTDSYNVSVNGVWTNGTTDTFKNCNVGYNSWANITVYAFNSSGNGTLSLGSVSDNVKTGSAPEPNDYIPPDPTNLQHTINGVWVYYTWQAGTGNVTDSYNVSLNSVWTNGTTDNYMNCNVGYDSWANITVWAFNASGNGTLSIGSISDNVKTGSAPSYSDHLSGGVDSPWDPDVNEDIVSGAEVWEKAGIIVVAVTFVCISIVFFALRRWL